MRSTLIVEVFVLVACFASASSWSPSAQDASFRKRNASGTRRDWLQLVASSVVAGSGALGVPGNALAESSEGPELANANSEVTSFQAYAVIPDSTSALDPQIQKLENHDLIKSIAGNENGCALWLGEHHNAVRDHLFQNEFIRSIHQQRRALGKAEPMAIGLEQVQVQFQPVLDDFVDGKLGLQEMRNLVDWDRRWTWSFDGYKPIFETAREMGIRLLALNVDSEDFSIVEKNGYPGLPREKLNKYIKDPIGFGTFAQSREFKSYVDYVITPSYDIHQQLGLLKHTMTGETLEAEMPFRNFLSGRLLWDEAMASGAYSWTKSNPGGIFFGLVGADHVKFRNGIPARYSRLAKQDLGTSLSFVINPTLIDSRPSGSVASVAGADSSMYPDRITLQLRYLKDEVDPYSEASRLPESTGGVLPLADYIVIN